MASRRRFGALLLACALGGAVAARAGKQDYRHQNPDVQEDAAPLPDRRPRDKVRQKNPFKLSTRIQFVLEDVDRDGGGGDEDVYFERFKMIMGWRMTSRLRFRSQFGASSGRPVIDDLRVTYRFPGYWRLWVGQFKSSLSRELLTSSGSQLFVKRSLAGRVFASNAYQTGNPGAVTALRGHGGGRAPGIQVSNYFLLGAEDPSTPDPGFRFTAGVRFGNRQNRISGEEHYLARLEFHPFGNPSYRSGNFPATRYKRLSLDFSWLHDPGSTDLDLDGDGLRTAADRTSREIVNTGWLFRRNRFSTQGEVFRQWQRPDFAAVAPGVDSGGYYAQLGWVWHPHRWEMGLRFSEVDPDETRAVDRRRERSVSLLRYVKDDLDKYLLEYVRTTDTARPGRDDRVVRLQYQTTF